MHSFNVDYLLKNVSIQINMKIDFLPFYDSNYKIHY